MRKFISGIVAATLLTVALGVPALGAAWDQFPTGADCQSSGFTAKHAVKLFDKDDWGTPKRVDCGNVFETNDDNYPQDADFSKAAKGFWINDWNDRTNSLVVFNRSSNFGMCFIFFEHADFKGKAWSFWVNAKPSGAKHTWRRMDTLGLQSNGLLNNSVSSYFGMPGWGGGGGIPANKSECHALTNVDVGVHGQGGTKW